MKLRGWVGFKVWVNCPNYTDLLLLGVPLCKPHEHEVWKSLHHHCTPKQNKEKSRSPGGQYPESLMCIVHTVCIVKNWPPRNCGFLACWSSFHIQVSSSISLSLEGRKFTVVCVLCTGRLDIFHRRGVPRYLGESLNENIQFLHLCFDYSEIVWLMAYLIKRWDHWDLDS